MFLTSSSKNIYHVPIYNVIILNKIYFIKKKKKKRLLTSPKTLPALKVAISVFWSSATTLRMPLLTMYISFPTSPLRHM